LLKRPRKDLFKKNSKSRIQNSEGILDVTIQESGVRSREEFRMRYSGERTTGPVGIARAAGMEFVRTRGPFGFDSSTGVYSDECGSDWSLNPQIPTLLNPVSLPARRI